ncbi:MAG: septum formation initiator family protein [Pseudomonadota bacterium]|nr:septum formation initiator family protein [Pseudomonadota bacterium]
MRKRLFDLVVMLFCLLLHGYFGWHYLYGSRNFATLEAIEERQQSLAAELAGEVAIRQAIEVKVALLRPENLDLDMLDETARRSLYYNDLRELVVKISPSNSVP